ncbi:MAG: hypothetical protein AAB527_03880, partial [Patescibacteria group bacterium]
RRRSGGAAQYTIFGAAPESPEYLKRLFEKQSGDLKRKEDELAKLLPNLSKMFETAGERPRVRFFEGKEGLITMREEFLKTKDKEIEVIYAYDIGGKIFSQEERDLYIKKRADKKVRIRAIYTGSCDEKLEPRPLTEGRIIPEKIFPLDVDIIIYGDSVAIASLKSSLMGVIIENKDIANSFRSIFNLAWDGAERYQ